MGFQRLVLQNARIGSFLRKHLRKLYDKSSLHQTVEEPQESLYEGSLQALLVDALSHQHYRLRQTTADPAYVPFSSEIDYSSTKTGLPHSHHLLLAYSHQKPRWRHKYSFTRLCLTQSQHLLRDLTRILLSFERLSIAVLPSSHSHYTLEVLAHRAFLTNGILKSPQSWLFQVVRFYPGHFASRGKWIFPAATSLLAQQDLPE